MSQNASLQTAPEYPESRRPGFVQKLDRPPVLCRATSLAFLRFEKVNLERAARFWTDFGLNVVDLKKDRLVMRSASTAPAVLVATKGKRSRYVGAVFEVSAETDFARLQRESDAKVLSSEQIPGGGQGVSLMDPDGNELWLIKGGEKLNPIPFGPSCTEVANTLGKARRVNSTVRSEIKSAQVIRTGHVVMQTTDFSRMTNWYMRHLGLIPTDVQYLPDGSPIVTFFRLDLGDVPADHHTVVIAGGIEPKYEHSAWEVADLDALGQGQQVLRAGGYRHMWGIGRHVLGSQLFDYWYDDDGFEFEHYTDGDLFTRNHETHYSPFSTGSIWAWGDDAPPTMFPKKSLGMLIKVIRMLRSGRMSMRKLQMIGGVVDRPTRPWL